MPAALIRRTISQFAATVLSVLEEVDEDGVTLSRRYELTRDGLRLSMSPADQAAAEKAFLSQLPMP